MDKILEGETLGRGNIRERKRENFRKKNIGLTEV